MERSFTATPPTKIKFEAPGGRVLRAPGNSGGGVTAAAAAVVPYLQIVSARPAYIPEPATTPAAGYQRYYLSWGSTNGTLADNWDNVVDVPVSGTTERYISMKAYINPTLDAIVVTHCEWVTFTQAQKDAGTFDTPDWGADGSRPAHVFYPLGQVNVEAGVATILNNGNGSLNIMEYVAGIDFSGTAVKFKKAFRVERVPV